MKWHPHQPDESGNCIVCGEAGRCPGLMPFVLRNEGPRTKRFDFTADKQRQTKLLSGLDCLPGQENLFDTDGEGR